MNKPIRILYVDDNPFDRELVRYALEHSDIKFQLTEADTGEEFKTQLSKGGYDLVLISK